MLQKLCFHESQVQMSKPSTFCACSYLALTNDLEAHSCFNTAPLVQTTKAQPSQRGMELVFPTALH